ncbi:hypothetical protein RHMOL_Rhmol02G0320300 [Rhododendron molle]|uniref:Uncharacterized protein n=2 Tax=Rhododendron molle TaxID=49168 RepID=A0ACC0PWZ7_RHOML|nr:hypothetical protein RHMOL_Rhmol02G0320300 [Rhododendron molle]KAI8569996.1 hypothetical protein RHMOL_Rhmol02G0320300 [Rhododendron molle]
MQYSWRCYSNCSFSTRVSILCLMSPKPLRRLIRCELNNDGLFDADISCSRRLRFDLIYLILTRLMSRQTGALQGPLLHCTLRILRGYVGIHSSGFRDFLLKPELLRAIVDSGFEHPSEGKFLITPIISASVVFRSLYVALATGVKSNSIFTIPARKLVWISCRSCPLSYKGISLPGVNIKVHKDLLKNACPHIPHIVVGTPGRILGLARDKDLGFKSVRHFIVDECDKMLESLVKLLHVDSLSRRFHNFGLFQSVTALKYYIQPGLDSLEETRKTLLDKLLEIDEKMGNPREEDIEPVKCCPNCQADGDGLVCVHCDS